MINFRFDHVGINVADLDISISFFLAMFGFKVLQRWETPRQAFVGIGDIRLGLIENKNYDYCIHTMAHIAFPCSKEEFAGMVAKIQELAAPIVSGPKPQREGETILFRDPSGNIFEVCYPAFEGQG